MKLTTKPNMKPKHSVMKDKDGVDKIPIFLSVFVHDHMALPCCDV